MKQENIPKLARYWSDTARDFDAIYTEQKGAVGRALDRRLRKDMYQRFDWVMEQSGDLAGASVCDIGCGSGRFAIPLAEKGARRVVGIDIAPDMLKLARELARKQGVDAACEFLHADVLDWKTEEQFDLVIAIGLWDYIADPVPRLRVIRSLTKGRFLSTWPRLWTWRAPIRKARLAAKGCPVYFFRRPEVQRCLEEAGFRVVSSETLGKLYCVEARPA